jgi:release factor glutamine methyltransferase
VTLRDVVARAARTLQLAGVPPREAELDAELLARHVLECDRAQWLVRREEQTPPQFAAVFESLLDRRTRREPMAYIIGRQEFWGRDFIVSPSVLIPRPETELLIEQVLAAVSPSAAPRVIDIGTGSGCIAISIALERPNSRVIATDASESALQVARENAHRLGAASVAFVSGEYFAGVPAPFDVVVANPPYVGHDERDSLQPEVLREPPSALFADDDGLAVIREIIARSFAALTPGGHLFVEIGWKHAAAAAHIVAGTPGLRVARIARDLQGIERVLVVERVIAGAE